VAVLTTASEIRLLNALWFSFLLWSGCYDAVGLVIDYPDSDTETESDTVSGGGAGPTDVPFMIGADISWVQEQEDQGVVFTDNGEEKDILEILSAHGFNFIRLRIFHDPGQPDGYQFAWTTRAEPYCDLLHTIEMAVRVKEAGMGLFLNFHYSDTWADPGNQIKPAAWASLDFEALRQALYEYTSDTLVAFRAAGALPDMVQLGNEITPGMLHPDGKTYDPDNWNQLALLLKTAVQAVEDVSPAIRTVMHLDRAGDYDATVWWLEEALSREVTFDVLAQSAYTLWQGEPETWRATFERLAADYPDLSFLIAEYAENHLEVNDIMQETPRGLGTFVWEPTADGEWGQGLFDMPVGEGEAVPRDELLLFDQMVEDYRLR
jgi:arabinogalactan endo-1,4-beta-galactosidase